MKLHPAMPNSVNSDGSAFSTTQEIEPEAYAHYEAQANDDGDNTEPTEHGAIDLGWIDSVPKAATQSHAGGYDELETMEDSQFDSQLVPKTPAPPKPYFANARSGLLGQSQLFAATQPSPGLNDTTPGFVPPSSARPTPYDFNIRAAPSSSPHNEVEVQSPSHRKSTYITSKSATWLEEGPAGNGFNKAIRATRTGPRNEYITVQASQDAKAYEPTTQATSLFDEFEEEERRANEERRRRRAIQLVQEPVSTSRKLISQKSEESDIVEVPSTAKRRCRSEYEDYLVQCEGADARDSQDKITNSQADTEAPTQLGSQWRKTDSEVEVTCDATIDNEDVCDPGTTSQTRICSSMATDDDDMVPETSPMPTRMPMFGQSQDTHTNSGDYSTAKEPLTQGQDDDQLAAHASQVMKPNDVDPLRASQRLQDSRTDVTEKPAPLLTTPRPSIHLETAASSMISTLTSLASSPSDPGLSSPITATDTADEYDDAPAEDSKAGKSGFFIPDTTVKQRSRPSRALRSAQHSTPSKLSRSASVLSSRDEGLFSNMAFCVSYSGRVEEKPEVISLIKQHGGLILENGFEDLFEMSTEALATPTSSHSSNTATSLQEQLSLKTEACTLGFTCLIADDFSRKAKYMQALALGLPCISGKWITSCVASNNIIPWEMYLLAAGKSEYLGGAVRSRTLTSYNAETASLKQVYESRPTMLEGKKILLVMAKGKPEQVRRPYLFLIQALGASQVRRVLSNLEARKVLMESAADGAWDCVYIDSEKNEAKRKEASKIIFEPVARKRKRSAAIDEKAPDPRKVQLISDEYVVQSLILGALIDE